MMPKPIASRAYIAEHADMFLERLKNGAKLSDLEQEFRVGSQGYLSRVLRSLGYTIPRGKRELNRPRTHRSYIESIAETLVAERKKGRYWKDIMREHGIKSIDYMRDILCNLGYTYLFVKESAKPAFVPEYLSIDFSKDFLERIGERRRRSFWALMHDAAFVNGFVQQSEKNIFYLDLLFKVTGRKAYKDVVSAREFNALYMAAAIVARDATMLERFRSKFVDHLKPRKYEEEPKDARREDYKGCLN